MTKASLLTRGLAAWLFALLVTAPPVSAAPVADLYSAQVPLADGDMDAAFAEAFRQVLVKVTGRRDAAAAYAGSLGNPARFVQQWRSNAAGQVEVGFDPLALRRALDSAGLPAWGDQRPLTLVWLALDTGGGQREILAAGEADGGDPLGPLAASQNSRQQAAIRASLLGAAAERGLPLLLPLGDSEDLGAVNFAELWGDFTEPVRAASARYQPDAVLIGRARGPDPATARVRWTLLVGTERMDWEGLVVDGPEGAADRFAEQLSAQGSAASAIHVEVAGVDSLDAYGRVLNYLQGLGIVESCQVQQVVADRVVFSLQVRGNTDRLMRTIALSRLLRLSNQPGGLPAGIDLRYLYDGAGAPPSG